MDNAGLVQCRVFTSMYLTGLLKYREDSLHESNRENLSSANVLSFRGYFCRSNVLVLQCPLEVIDMTNYVYL